MTAGAAVAFAGGGTGGHVSPGLAIAERLVEMDPNVPRVFLCSDRAVDRSMLERAGERFRVIPARPFGARPSAAWRFVRGWRPAVEAARAGLVESGAGVVVALGGFVAAPAVEAARGLGLPTVMVNLDAVPGKANRWLARRCDRVLSAVAVAGPGPGGRWRGVPVVGMPLRRAALAPGPAEACRARLGLDAGVPTLLVTGASQGAASVNELLVHAVGVAPELFAGWQVHHLVGRHEPGAVEAAYRAAGVRARVEGFAHEMGVAWGAAEAAVSRAGASSVAEAAANAVPTLFLPYPWHRDRHQYFNARPLVEAGGAFLAEDRIDAAATFAGAEATLRRLLGEADARAAARATLRANPPPDAASTVAREALDLLRSRGAPGVG